MKTDKEKQFRKRYFARLAGQGPEEATPEQGIAALIAAFLEDMPIWDGNLAEQYKNAFLEARRFVLPMNPPRLDLDHAVRLVFQEHGLTIKRGRFSEPTKGRGRAITELNPPADEKRRPRKRRHKAQADGVQADGVQAELPT
jgi:poly(A) polymerase